MITTQDGSKYSWMWTLDNNLYTNFVRYPVCSLNHVVRFDIGFASLTPGQIFYIVFLRGNSPTNLGVIPFNCYIYDDDVSITSGDSPPWTLDTDGLNTIILKYTGANQSFVNIQLQVRNVQISDYPGIANGGIQFVSSAGTTLSNVELSPAAGFIIAPIVVNAFIATPSTVGSLLVEDPPDMIGLESAERVNVDPGFSSRRSRNLATPGIYLHWTIPRGFRGGTHNHDTGIEPDYAVPNIWLITRIISQSSDPTQIGTSAWIVESDAIVSGSGDADNPSPSYPTAVGNAWKAEYIGQKIPLGSWSRSGNVVPNLTIIGSANPLFADYQPHCYNVFSTLDPISISGTAVISYSVIGWYYKGINDPLSTITYDSLQKINLKNTVKLSPETYARTFMTGTVYDINWTSSGQVESTCETLQAAVGTQVQCSIGTGALDCISTMLNNNVSDQGSIEKNIFDSVIHGVSSKLAESNRIEETFIDNYTQRFSSSSGGSVPVVGKPPILTGYKWEAVSGNINADNIISGDLLNKLSDLNESQEELDYNARQLINLQSQLFAYWWQEIQDPSLQSEIGSIQGTIDDLVSQIDSDSKLLSHLLEDCNLKLVTRTSNPFYVRKEPSLSLAGIQTGWSAAYFNDLPCRTISQNAVLCSQIVSQYNDGKGHIVNYSSLNKGTPFQPAVMVPLSTLFSAELTVIQQLLTEFILYDIDVSTAMCKNLGIDYPTYFSTLTDPAITPNNPLLSSAMTMTQPAYFSQQQWSTQPWFPLASLWEINWTPIAYMTSNYNGNGYGATNNWGFSATAGNMYYEGAASYQLKTLLGSGNGGPQSITGQTLIVPQGKTAVKSRLKQLMQEDPSLIGTGVSLDSLLEQVEQWDIVSQKLTGFIDALLKRQAGTHAIPQPDDSMFDAIGSQSKYIPCDTGYSFQPVANGTFQLAQLYVMDRFGQQLTIIDITDENNQIFSPISISTCYTITSTTSSSSSQQSTSSSEVIPIQPIEVGNTTETAPTMQIQPTILQSSRLNGKYITVNETTGSPICGWLLFDEYEMIIQVYDSTDTSNVIPGPIGYIVINTEAPEGEQLTWNSYFEKSIINTYVQQATQLICNQTANDDQSSGEIVLQWLTEYFGNVQSIPSHNVQDILIPSARFMAIVETVWSLELENLPILDNTADGGSESVLNFSFPLQLGALNTISTDGIIAYFENGATEPDDLIINNLNYQTSTSSIQLTPYFGNSVQEQTVIILVDPFKSICGYTQILPPTKIKIPDYISSNALKSLSLLVSNGPCLITESIDNATNIRIPHPTSTSSPLQWVTPYIVNNLMQIKTLPLAAIDTRARLEKPPYTAVEGYYYFNHSPPSDVSGLTSKTPTSTTIPVTWVPSSGNPSFYSLNYRVHGDVNYILNNNVTGGSTYTGTFTGLNQYTSYDLQVVAVNIYGKSPGTSSGCLLSNVVLGPQIVYFGLMDSVFIFLANDASTYQIWITDPSEGGTPALGGDLSTSGPTTVTNPVPGSMIYYLVVLDTLGNSATVVISWSQDYYYHM